MKYLAIFLICLIAMTAVSAKISHRRHKTHHKAHHKGAISNMILFANGIVISLTGGVDLMACAPAEWGVPQAKDETKIESAFPSLGGVLSTIVNVLGKGIDLACKARSVIVKFLTLKMKRRANRRRFFMQMKTYRGRKRLERWFVSSVVNSVKSAASSVGNAVSSAAKSVGSAVSSAASSAVDMAKTAGNAVVSGAKYVGGKIVEGAKFVGNALLTGATAIFNGVVSSIKSVYEFFMNFFKSPLFNQIKQFVMCLIPKWRALKNAVMNVKNFISAISQATTNWAGFINVIIGAICSWRDFKKSSRYPCQCH